MATDAWPDIAGRFDGRTHILPVRVYFEDTDFSGLVYHASFLRFCERGRSDLLRLAGVNHADLINGADGGDGVYFAVRRMEIDYLSPARIDELLIVRSRFERLSGARIMLDQAVERDGEALMRATVTVVILGPDGRPRRVTQALKRVLGPLVG